MEDTQGKSSSQFLLTMFNKEYKAFGVVTRKQKRTLSNYEQQLGEDQQLTDKG
jgi:hypothetical protein